MIKQLTLNGKEVVIVEVPEGAIRFNVEEGLLRWTTACYHKIDQVENDKSITLPISDDDYELVGSGLCSEITEAEAREIVGRFYDNDGIPGYYNYGDDCKTLWRTATDSLRSFVLANGYDPLKAVFLIKVK